MAIVPPVPPLSEQAAVSAPAISFPVVKVYGQLTGPEAFGMVNLAYPRRAGVDEPHPGPVAKNDSEPGGLPLQSPSRSNFTRHEGFMTRQQDRRISMADRVGVAVGPARKLSPRWSRGRCAGELSDREEDDLVGVLGRLGQPVDPVGRVRRGRRANAARRWRSSRPRSRGGQARPRSFRRRVAAQSRVPTVGDTSSSGPGAADPSSDRQWLREAIPECRRGPAPRTGPVGGRARRAVRRPRCGGRSSRLPVPPPAEPWSECDLVGGPRDTHRRVG
jgi:hypothetical protein